MKQYRVARSIYGDLGSLRRNAVLIATDPRLKDKKRAVDDLVKRGLLIEEDADAEAESADSGPPKRKAK